MRGLYLACCTDTAWAEWLRATAEDGVPPAARLPRDMWSVAVDIAGVADLAAPGALARIGLARIRPTQRQWPACQAVGEALWLDGAAGLLAPSAAHEGHQVLCVFRTEHHVPGITELHPPTRFDAIPVIPVGLRT